MVQHTQTHTKGPNAESSEGIATKIAIESQRKSEAGLFSRSGRRLSVKGGGISKRGSVSSASGSEAPRISRRDRLQSLPGLAMTPSDCSLPSPTSIPPSPVKITKRRQQSRARQGDRRKSLSLNLTAAREMRRESISHPPTATAESWYASKLHHRPSIDFGMLAFGNNNNNSDLNRLERFPPVGHFSDTSNLQQSSPSPFAWARHPLSPEHSSHSDDGDSDGASPYTRTLESDRLSPWTGSHVNSSTSSLNRPMIDDDQSMDVVKMEECTLPPLRSIPFGASAEGPQQTRLPSIVQTRYRSQSVFHPLSQGPPDFGGPEAFMASRSTRRLSLVDLNAPIQDATRAVHNSMMNQMQPSGQNRVLSGPVEAQDNTAAKMEGVDVSMDEMQALEAFGELWSQGRAVEPAANPTTSAPLTATTTVVKEQRLNRPRSMTPVNVNDEYLSSAPPGPDFGRRVGGPVFSDENNGHVPSHGRGRYDSMTDSRMPTGMMDIQ
ncbi:hypothetical protein BGW38_006663 [Lunasporangiospora selenospora]|uniref:Uncharacterized protein n=1 Tax=Lunasporangiospora selenospora TaxID=979761 RepID=A0A9P6FMN0_9FUNG|nr:hypothetical protein BGW38_006663 [Lunasporangiospora selenospora]